jgi:hypothetical protein
MNMKKSAVILTAALLSSALFAQEQRNGVYLGAGLGLEAMPKHVDNGLGLSVKGGVALDQLLSHLGAEAELTTSLVAPEYSSDKNIDVFTLGVYATYTIDIPNSPVAVRPKFGVILPNLADEINSRDVALSTGVAGLLKLNDQLDAYVEYVNTSEMMNNYMVGVEVNF